MFSFSFLFFQDKQQKEVDTRWGDDMQQKQEDKKIARHLRAIWRTWETSNLSTSKTKEEEGKVAILKPNTTRNSCVDIGKG